MAEASKSGDIAALEVLARAQIETGAYEAAEATATTLAKKKGGQAAGQTLHATVEHLTGRYKEAIKRMRKVVKKHPRFYEARVVLTDALVATGQSREKLPEADEIADFWQEGEVTSAADLTALGRALHLTEYFKNANEIYQEATEKDPDYLPAYLAWAQLFLEKEDEKQAGDVVGEVLKRNPNHPLALALSAKMDLSSDNDPIKALKTLDKARAINPKLMALFHQHASVLLESEQVAEALVELQRGLAVNPHDAKTHAMVAACHLLLEDDKASEASLKKALKVNKRYAAGYHIVAEYAVRAHRYKDAIALEKRAIKLNDRYWPSYVGLGMGYSRVGQDDKANEMLQLAFENDPFNVRAFNMTAHFYDEAAKKMEWLDAGQFKVRIDKREKTLLEKLMPDFLTEAFKTHQKKYSFTPAKPLHIEIFKDDAVFEVRSVGYPGMGAIRGICFGHVVTMRSPSGGGFNWAMVMWHELAHVWHIQMSKSRVPRWFTEGLAEHETTLRRPEWKREMDVQLWEAHKAGRLKGIDRFNTMFTQARSINDIVLAYYYASKVVAYIHKTWGFEVFKKMLRGWGQRKSTEVVFREVLKLELAAFDKRLAKWLSEDLLKHFDGQFVVKASDAKDVDDDSKTVHSAEAAMHAKKWDEASKLLDSLFAKGVDSAELRALRARSALSAKSWKDAAEHANKALVLNPQDGRSAVVLAKAAKELGDSDGRYAALKRLADLDENSPTWVLTILEEAMERRDTAALKEYSERAMHIAPFARSVRRFRGEAFFAGGDAKSALSEAEIALDIPSKEGLKEVNLLRARALIQLKRGKEAKEVLSQLDAEDPEVKKLLEGLD